MLNINAGQCAAYADKFEIQAERYDGEYVVKYIFDNISVWDNGRKLSNYSTECHGLRVMVDIRPMVAEWLDSYVNGTKGMEFSSPCEEDSAVQAGILRRFRRCMGRRAHTGVVLLRTE